MNRKVVIVISAIAILFGGFAISNLLGGSKKQPKRKKTKKVATVFVDKVQNGNVPISVDITGSLVAKDRVELFAEVQGVMEKGVKAFKSGTDFSTGETLLNINDDVFEASLKSQRSSFENLLSAVLPDLRLDFPETYDIWNGFAQKINPEKSLPTLPSNTNEKVKMFLTGRNVFSTYYSVKNAELTLSKYTLNAPFNGVLTNAQVTEGTLVRPGQKLGSFIKPGVYELEASVPAALAKYVKPGQEVNLQEPQTNSQYTGTVIRVNKSVNASTQMVSIFIEVSSTMLSEGEFLEAKVMANTVSNSFEIPRSALLTNNKVYIAKDTLLRESNVKPVFFKEKTVVVQGLKNGELVVVKPVPGGHPGMLIKSLNEKN